MSWALTATAGMAALGAYNADQQRKAQQKQNQLSADITAAQTQYSPWTKITPQAFQGQAPTGNAVAGAAEGALGGAMFGMKLQDRNAKIASQNEAQGNELEKEFDATPEAAMAPPKSYGPQSYEEFYGKPSPYPSAPTFGPPTADQFYGKKMKR